MKYERSNVWIGLSGKTPNDFKWSDGTPVGYLAWTSEPKMDSQQMYCGQMEYDNGVREFRKWIAVPCTEKASLFLCKKKADKEETKKPGPVTKKPDPGTGNPDPGTGNPDPGTGNPDPGTGNPAPDTGKPRPGTGGPSSYEEDDDPFVLYKGCYPGEK
ncbi:hypothetical protein RB195_001000 [Necator americanus]